MTILIPVAAAAAAALLTIMRSKRLTAWPMRARVRPAHPRALAEGAAAGFTVLLVGAILSWAMGPTSIPIREGFTALALVICCRQYRTSLAQAGR